MNLVREVYYCLKNNIERQPVCEACGNPKLFNPSINSYDRMCRKCGRKSRPLTSKEILNNLDIEFKTNEDIVKFLESYSMKQNGTICAKRSKSILESRIKEKLEKYVSNKFPWILPLDSGKKFTEILYCIKNNIVTKPVCKDCGGDVSFYSTSGYRNYCEKCSHTQMLKRSPHPNV